MNLIFLRQFLILSLLFFFLPCFSQSKDPKKSVNLEWENVPGSFGYELEIYFFTTSSDKSLIGTYKVKTTAWSSDLEPGRYQFRMRSLDIRGVPGVWGELISFDVLTQAPTLVNPSDKSELKSENSDQQNVEFEWKPSLGAALYRIVVTDSNNSNMTFETNETKASIPLSVAKKYSWKVYSLNVDKKLGEDPKETFYFSLIGKKIDLPIINKPDDEFITKISWSKPRFTQKLNYTLTRQNSKGTWEILETQKDTNATELKINPKYQGGIFKISIRAFADLRTPSDIATLEFPIYDGPRTPVSMEEAKLKKALENDKNNYFIASYLISSLSYVGENKETGNRLSYTVLGGTGRLGYVYTPKGKWGFLGILDYGGVNIQKKNYTFGSIEAQAVWRTFLSSNSQFGFSIGGFIKEIPEAKSYELTDLSVKNIQQMGPLLGMQYRKSLSPKLGIQFNSQLNHALIKLATPNGKNLISSTSYQIGVLGSYKIRKNFTGFAGVAQRLDKAQYQAKAYDGSDEINFANEGDSNIVEMRGTYLNLYAEWGF